MAEQREVQEGTECNDPECIGIYEYQLDARCYCHLSPPCHYCVENPLVCSDCGRED